MRKITNLLSSLFLLLVFMASISFSYFNTTPVSISIIIWEFPAVPVSVWIIGAFATGGALGLLLGQSIFMRLKYRSEIKHLRRQLASVNREISQSQSMDLK